MAYIKGVEATNPQPEPTMTTAICLIAAANFACGNVALGCFCLWSAFGNLVVTDLVKARRK